MGMTISSNKLEFECASNSLLEGIRFLCLRMGILSKGNRDTKQIIIPKTLSICNLLNLSEVGIKEKEPFFTYENYLFSRINSIEEGSYKGVLYDLQMKEEHNYLLHQSLVHNGGGKRNGSIAAYLEPWHADVFDFLHLRKNHGNEEERARDLFYALWTPDLFMERVSNNGDWTLMCPD
jgi:hypothetical protein